MPAGRWSSASPRMLVAAHPDDETIGAGIWLQRLPRGSSCILVHTTDGAPRDPHFSPAAAGRSREEVARARREEVEAAATLVGLSQDRMRQLGAVDQEAAFALGDLTRQMLSLLMEATPALVITHAYEGGHPDHDATAFVVHAAAELLRRAGLAPPALLEMTAYHGLRGRFTPGEFLPAPGFGSSTVEPTPEELAMKQRMLACFTSQADVIAQFPLGSERFREAPRYDFTRPPHGGQLYYERLGWPMTGAQWRALADGALVELGFQAGLCL